ncbi:MAG: 30S ribosomal protein S11 [Candidatus Spechtbacterales bacterium]
MGKKRVIKETEGGISDASNAGLEIAKKQTETKRAARLASSRIYISASYNNTLISVTDSRGDVLVWSSAGAMGFKGPKKATPYAASKVVENVFEKLGVSDLGKVSVYVQGVGSGRDAAIRALVGRGINIFTLQDSTPIPHNGCRARKARRV